MKIVKIYKEEDLMVMTHCTMCNTHFHLKWTIGWPYKNFCSNDCRERYRKVRLNGYPKYSDWEMDFWEKWARKRHILQQKLAQIEVNNSLAHWLSSKNTGSKVAQKLAQKSGSTLPLGEGEPLSHEPVSGENLEPLFPMELNFEDKK